MRDANPSYWTKYTILQHTKHKIIREYLNGWFPKLGSWAGRILYIDTHAGRGKYLPGQEGSPLIALKTFLDHGWRNKILGKSEVRFIFIEADEENVHCLDKEIKKLGRLPPKVTYALYNFDSFMFLGQLLDEFEKERRRLAPCLMFVDPYGFKVPCEVLKKIKSHPRSELLITLIWRELDMAMQQVIKQGNSPQELKKTIDEVLGGDEWTAVCSIEDPDIRGEKIVQLLKEKIGAKWATFIRMLGRNQKTRYFLLHLTDNDAGRDLMKEVMWKCCPYGGYYARKSDDPNQYFLIKPEPDLKGLKIWLVDKLSHKCYTWNDLVQLLREEIWLKKHLWQVIRGLKNANRITATNYTGKFSQQANPTFCMIKD